MSNIDVGKIQIIPFEFESILEIKIEKELNEHAKLYACGIIKDDIHFTPVIGITPGTNIKCENAGQVYFNGVLQNIKISRMDDIYHLEVYAVSNTVLLDKVKYKRSFQDNDQTYQSIVESVIADNKGAVTYNASEMKVENIILQYNETDWEFAKRLASHTQDVLIAITDDNPAFHFGVPGSGDAKLLTTNYAISKDFEAFWRMLTESDPLTADDVMLYTIETDVFVCELGEKLNLNGTDLHVCRISLSLVDSALKMVYTLCAKKAISTPKAYNRAITGLVLDGVVLKAENDNVKLHLHIDEKQDEGTAHLFVYATGYSMEGHTGWYVMPEKDDTVQLLFPDEDEKNAYAASSVRQDDTGKTADPMVKYLRTSYGKEIKLQEKEILITAKDDTTFIRINEDSGISSITPKPISISSGSTMSIKSEDDMTITTNKNLKITAKESIVVNCSEKGENNIKIEPPTGIEVKTDQQIKMNSDNATLIDSKNKLKITSTDEMEISSSTKLIESALTGLELSCSDSSIKMDGNIDMSAELIKQN
jgi:hypothetical protein